LNFEFKALLTSSVLMNILLYIPLLLSSLFLSDYKVKSQVPDICRVYGAIYVETQNRNRADMMVYVDKDGAFPEMKVFVQENQFYADRPGMWYFTNDRYQADFVIFIEKEEGRTRHIISYTDLESEAGCRQ